MSKTKIDFAAEYGGKDSFRKILPCFKAFKTIAKELSLTRFPFAELVFILRVSGDIKQYSGQGLDAVDIPQKDDYVSVDIVLQEENIDEASDFVPKEIAKVGKYLQNYVDNGKMDAFDNKELLNLADHF